jgi:hypothetical protein
MQSQVLEVLRRHAREGPVTPKKAGVKATSMAVKVVAGEDEDEDDEVVGAQMLECEFEDGWGRVDFVPGSVKAIGRMQDKLHKYVGKAGWPLAANILDPVRCTVVCSGPARMAEVVRWLLAAGDELPAVRLRNKFSWPVGAVEDGYRDVNVSVVATHPVAGLRIIGEIQVVTLLCNDI